MNPSSSFADRFQELAVSRSPFCVGVDPAKAILKSWGLPIDASGLRAFCDRILDAGHGIVGVYKPQSAFFEQFGPDGMLEMQRFVDGAHRQGALVIIDCKRGDVAHTAEAYGEAMLGADSPFRGDAMTVTPYLGRDSLLPFAEMCGRQGKGMFVVLKTSNEGSRDYQDQVLQATGRPLYESIAAMVNEVGKPLIGDSGYSSVGAVVGATFPEDARRLRSLMPQAFILVTGYGAQGARGRNAAICFNADGLGAVVSSSRAITYAYADKNVNSGSFAKCVRENTLRMIDDIMNAVTAAARAG